MKFYKEAVGFQRTQHDSLDMNCNLTCYEGCAEVAVAWKNNQVSVVLKRGVNEVHRPRVHCLLVTPESMRGWFEISTNDIRLSSHDDGDSDITITMM